MTGYVFTAGGTSIQLPAPVSWTFQYTAGVPCDSFRLRCIWAGENAVRPSEWATFQALEGSEVKFTGVVDECETVQGSEGSYFEISGRGMAARLLDNEALSQDYEVATLADILRDHVAPYGIQVGAMGDLPAVSGFSVQSGESEWQVLYQFARYHGGVSPRFDREGRLYLTPFPDREALVVDGTVAVARLCWRERRYGVLSQVLVRDRTTLAVEPVDNAPFQAQGGLRRQVLTMPGKSSYQAMRYSGEYQLEQARKELHTLELELPAAFAAWPGELVELNLTQNVGTGLWRVRESVSAQAEQGSYTRLTLAPPDVVG